MELEHIFRAHQKEVFVYLLRTVGDRHLAEDLAQETFLRACRGALLYRADSSVRTWLFAIARNTLADHYRRRTPELLQEAPEISRDIDPSQRIAIEAALKALPLVQREAVVLCDVIGLSPAEAAETTGLTANAFRVRLHRARTRFREVYGDE